MFEKISMLWKGDAPLQNEYNQFVEMMKLSRQLFIKIKEAIAVGNEQLIALGDEVYDTDIQINRLERKIRKAIVTHLSANPGQETIACLVLMSVVKDAERLGDFCKNLYEAGMFWSRSCSELYFCDKITEFEKHVISVYDDTIEAFEVEDSVLATEIIKDESKWNKRFDSFIGELAESDVPTREAVSCVLMARSLKRLQAHLSNIASSVVLPVHHMDHRPPKHIGESD